MPTTSDILIAQYKEGESLLVEGANPVRSEQLAFEETEILRWLGCPNYSSCLAHAALIGWTSFVCTECELDVRNTNAVEGK